MKKFGLIYLTVFVILLRNSIEYFFGLYSVFQGYGYFASELFGVFKKLIFYSGPILLFCITQKQNIFDKFDGLNRWFWSLWVYSLWIFWYTTLLFGSVYFPEFFPIQNTYFDLYFYILVVNSIIEESVFRGYILYTLQKYFGKFKSNIIQSFLFAIVHIPFYVSMIQHKLSIELGFGNLTTLFFMLLDVFFLGFVWGWLKQKTNSLRPSIILHSIHNGLLLYLL